MRISGIAPTLALLAFALGASATVDTAGSSGLTQQQLTRIQSDVTKTLDRLALHLSFLASPDTDEADLADAIEMQFAPPDNIFWNKEFELDDDADPRASAKGQQRVRVDEYLAKFHFRVKARSADAISLAILDFSPVYRGENGLFMQVIYRQRFSAVSPQGDPFPDQSLRMAYLRIERLGAGFRSYIAGIDFASAARVDSRGKNVVPISGSAPGSMPDRELKRSERYYVGMLHEGIDAMQRENFAAAYYALREARQGSSTETDARGRLSQLVIRMNDKGLDYKSGIGKGLLDAGDRLMARYLPEAATRYFIYAKEADPAVSFEASAKLEKAATVLEKQRMMEALLREGAAGEALSAYRGALDSDSGNPVFATGLARAYAMLGRDSAAFGTFQSAIRSAPGFPELQQAYGIYFMRRRSFRAAHEAFVKYQGICEDPGAPSLLAQIAYTKGLSLLLENQLVFAADSLKAAVIYNPGMTEAFVGMAELFLRQGNMRAANKSLDLALAIDGRFADAFHKRGRVLEAQSNTVAAIRAYQEATKLGAGVAEYFWDLARLQMENPEDDYTAAIQGFTTCIGLCADKGLGVQAYLKRGRCYMLRRKYVDAEADFRTYEKLSYTKLPGFYKDFVEVLKRNGKMAEAERYLAAGK